MIAAVVTAITRNDGGMLDRRAAHPHHETVDRRRNTRGTCARGRATARGTPRTSRAGADAVARAHAPGRVAATRSARPRTAARWAGRGTPCTPSAGTPSRTRRARTSAVIRKMPMRMLTTSSISSSVSVGKNVEPRIVNAAAGGRAARAASRSCGGTGWRRTPPSARTRPRGGAPRTSPATSFGRIQRRDPSSFIVGRTRPTASGTVILAAAPARPAALSDSADSCRAATRRTRPPR